MKRTKEQLYMSLLEDKYVTKEALTEIIREEKKTRKSIGMLLLDGQHMKPKDFIQFVQEKMEIPYANLNIYIIDPNVFKMVPKNICLQYKLLPLLRVKNIMNVAMVDPTDNFVLDSLRQTIGCNIAPLISTEKEIAAAIEKFYKPGKRINYDSIDLYDQTTRLNYEIEKGFSALNEQTVIQDSVISQLVNIIIMKAIEVKASDIHIEHDEIEVRVRFRIDGILHEVMSLSDDVRDNLVSRIKIVSNMDIAEKRVPQDGRTSMQTAGKNIDIRVSTYPANHGEKIVMRILDKTGTLITLEQMGFTKNNLSNFKKIIKKPNGIILVTGPTGSGKTSTLYAALDSINSMDKNIITIEDPIEYELPHITQGQVNPKAGFTFAGGLRAILRQDPDIIMVGEIRDLETAETAIRAALTGHLVFSTLHTNDAPGSMTRLIDMGVEPFLVASSIIGVLAQRLVRTICSKCKESYTPSPAMLEDLMLPKNKEFTFYEGKGCKNCNETGYKGRTAIHEFLIPSEEIKKSIIYKESASTIKQMAVKTGMKSLREAGFIKVIEGVTTVEEVLRVTQCDEIEE